MGTLLLTTIIAAVADSVNPIAIAQQLLLQSMVRKKHHIWGFIIGIGMTNFLFGMVIYFGLADVIRTATESINGALPSLYQWASLLGGLFLVAFAIHSFRKKPTIKEEKASERSSGSKKSLGFWNVTFMGVVSCLMELTSALPYLGYLALLIQANVSNVGAVLILLFYNVLFSWPLIVLAIAAYYYERYFVRIYARINSGMALFLQTILPTLLLLVGVGLVGYSVISFGK